MDEYTVNYLTDLLPIQAKWVNDLEGQAKRDRIPIMDSIGMNFVMQLIRLNKPERILEIGTAIGYSALRLLEAHPKSKITTIEKDEKRYNQALSNLKMYDPENKINVILGDAKSTMEEMVKDKKTFDCIFIDAAKGEYQRYFELADALLVNNGFIIADNVLFRGYVADNDFEHHRYRSLVNRLREFNGDISSHPDYHTSIVPIGDGVAISYKCNGEGD